MNFIERVRKAANVDELLGLAKEIQPDDKNAIIKVVLISEKVYERSKDMKFLGKLMDELKSVNLKIIHLNVIAENWPPSDMEKLNFFGRIILDILREIARLTDQEESRLDRNRLKEVVANLEKIAVSILLDPKELDFRSMVRVARLGDLFLRNNPTIQNALYEKIITAALAALKTEDAVCQFIGSLFSIDLRNGMMERYAATKTSTFAGIIRILTRIRYGPENGSDRNLVAILSIMKNVCLPMMRKSAPTLSEIKEIVSLLVDQSDDGRQSIKETEDELIEIILASVRYPNEACAIARAIAVKTTKHKFIMAYLEKYPDINTASLENFVFEVSGVNFHGLEAIKQIKALAEKNRLAIEFDFLLKKKFLSRNSQFWQKLANCACSNDHCFPCYLRRGLPEPNNMSGELAQDLFNLLAYAEAQNQETIYPLNFVMKLTDHRYEAMLDFLRPSERFKDILDVFRNKDRITIEWV